MATSAARAGKVPYNASTRRRLSVVEPFTGADPEEVANWSAELPDSFIQCRDMGHTWRPFTARYVPEMHAYERTLRCGRCKTERNQSISESGMILAGGYDYPEGYQAPKGSGRIDGAGRGRLRLESTLRLIAHDEID